MAQPGASLDAGLDAAVEERHARATLAIAGAVMTAVVIVRNRRDR